ncbi:MAG: hypothetical protein M1608_06410, partial [Candidatus Omnitrophica bacterium]|nr:hypothetical protein [Candidatus Omnitrophota bacterium]
LQKIAVLSPFVPAYYGANIVYDKKFAFIVMEYLQGQDFKFWCGEAARNGFPPEWANDFREAVHEALSIVGMFHQHKIILLDFKSDNIIRLTDRRIKLVDLGALYTPRHSREPDKFVYSATPDHAELLIDVSNMETGNMPTEASDIF